MCWEYLINISLLHRTLFLTELGSSSSQTLKADKSVDIFMHLLLVLFENWKIERMTENDRKRERETSKHGFLLVSATELFLKFLNWWEPLPVTEVEGTVRHVECISWLNFNIECTVFKVKVRPRLINKCTNANVVVVF